MWGINFEGHPKLSDETSTYVLWRPLRRMQWPNRNDSQNNDGNTKLKSFSLCLKHFNTEYFKLFLWKVSSPFSLLTVILQNKIISSVQKKKIIMVTYRDFKWEVKMTNYIMTTLPCFDLHLSNNTIKIIKNN